MAEHGSAQTPENGGYEKRDFNIRLILISAGILTITVVFSFIIVRLTYIAMSKDIDRRADDAPPMLEADILPPEPRLRVNARMRLDQLHAYEDDLLNHYAWVDEAGGIARIPVARAKALLLSGVGMDPVTQTEDPVASEATESHDAPAAVVDTHEDGDTGHAPAETHDAPAVDIETESAPDAHATPAHENTAH